MNITLRKANAVQLSINEMVRGLTFDTSVSLNEFEDATAQIKLFATRLIPIVQLAPSW
jgi:hypothetical protein